MTTDTIRRFIQVEILNDESHTLDSDQDLLLSNTLDSLSVVRLVEFIESETGSRIPAEDVTLDNFGTVNRIAAYCASRVA